MFTISLHQSDTTITSTENRRQKLIKATTVQKDEVLDCWDRVESNSVYQMNNACYKSYTIESIQKSDKSDIQTVQRGHESWKNIEPCLKRLRCVYW